jgi:hypothetical protein
MFIQLRVARRKMYITASGWNPQRVVEGAKRPRQQ